MITSGISVFLNIQKNIKELNWDTNSAGNIGFIDVQTLITQLLSYFRVITNPRAVFLTTDSISDNALSDESAKERLNEMVDGTLKIASKIQE